MGQRRRMKPQRPADLRLTQQEQEVMAKLFYTGPRSPLTPEEWKVADQVAERAIDITIREKIQKGELRPEDVKT